MADDFANEKPGELAPTRTSPATDMRHPSSSPNSRVQPLICAFCKIAAKNCGMLAGEKNLCGKETAEVRLSNESMLRLRVADNMWDAAAACTSACARLPSCHGASAKKAEAGQCERCVNHHEVCGNAR